METITDLNTETVDNVKSLIKLNDDACEGFAEACDSVDDDVVADAFRRASRERGRFRDELKAALSMSDEETPDGGTLKGAIHRNWMNIRTALNGGDKEVALAEVVRGETSLVDAYQDVLVDTGGSPLNSILHRHIESIKGARDHFEAQQKDAS